MPSAALYANRLHSGGFAPGAAFPGTPGAAAPGGLEGARWVSERSLPLWLVRSHEEKARREAAILATQAQQEAERVRRPSPCQGFTLVHDAEGIAVLDVNYTLC